MTLTEAAPTPDTPEQRRRDQHALRRAFVISAAAAAVLWLIHLAVVLGAFNPMLFTVQPHTVEGLVGLLTAPLLHGGWAHLFANTFGVLVLGTLAFSVYPRATARALPLVWLGSGVSAWALGNLGEHHLGMSGVTHGLMFLVFTLGLLRRDRSAIAAGMIAFLLFGGMLITVFPREAGVSWQAHLGGGLSGVLAAFMFRHADPLPPRRVYAYELEEDATPEMNGVLTTAASIEQERTNLNAE